MKEKRDFLDLNRISPNDLKGILDTAHIMKRDPDDFTSGIMQGKRLALIFEKPSTRTRVSFDAAMHDLGGHPITLSQADMQLGHGETIGDTGRVLSRFAHLIVLRTFDEQKLHALAETSSIPVINGLTNQSHPCQVMADIMTIEEHFGSTEGLKVVWAGDGDNNVLNSFIHAAPVFKFKLHIVCPPEYSPKLGIVREAERKEGQILISHNVSDIRGAHVVVTDTWVSMHTKDEAEIALRKELFLPFQVNAAFMTKRAKPDAIVLHCLPAHRGEEITDDVIDGLQSAVWDEAENRMHVQKAILRWCLDL